MTVREMHESTPWWVKALIPILLSIGLSGALTFSRTTQTNDRELAQRVSALEAHRTDDTSRLDRIENKIDKVLTWAGVK